MVGGSQDGAAALTKAGSTRRPRSATSNPPCRLNAPSPDQRWTTSFAANRPKRSSICWPPDAGKAVADDRRGAVPKARPASPRSRAALRHDAACRQR